MIGVLEVKNFKSIASLKLDCKRLNIFIGQPNSGKSNILESLGLLSYGYYARYDGDARRFIRFEDTSNLFYDNSLDSTVDINWDSNSFVLSYKDGGFRGESEGTNLNLVGDHSTLSVNSHANEALAPFKFYRFRPAVSYGRRESDYLIPPSGDNLVSLLLTHKEIRSLANELFSPFGLRLGVRPAEGKLETIKDFQDIIVSYPYGLTSDTLQRVVFYMAAILSNKDSVLVFEEPESHAFPYYTKYLAETIALDESGNQYFISTHNPYFLLPILEKSAKDEIAIFVTYFEDYQTKVKPLGEKQLEELTEIDVFSNLDRFLEEK